MSKVVRPPVAHGSTRFQTTDAEPGAPEAIQLIQLVQIASIQAFLLETKRWSGRSFTVRALVRAALRLLAPGLPSRTQANVESRLRTHGRMRPRLEPKLEAAPEHRQGPRLRLSLDTRCQSTR